MADVHVSLRATGSPADHWLSPEMLVAQASLAHGMTAAVFESEPGFYAQPLARSLEPAGRLLPVRCCGLSLQADIPEESCHLLVLGDLWHANASSRELLSDLRRALRPDGHLVLFDWNQGGPCPPGPPLAARVAMHDAICAAERASLTVLHTRLHDGGYVLVLQPTDETVQS